MNKNGVFPLQNGDIKKCFGFSQTKLFFVVVVFLPFFFFCSLGLKDAYFSAHVNESSQEYLKFGGAGGGGGEGGQLYMFTAFADGLASCLRLFTNLLKPMMAPFSLCSALCQQSLLMTLC